MRHIHEIEVKVYKYFKNRENMCERMIFSRKKSNENDTKK